MKKPETLFIYSMPKNGRSKGKVVNAVVSGYHTYFSTGMIPFNPSNPSEKAKMFLRFLGLSSLIPNKKKRKS
jgi:hypothetical protein